MILDVESALLRLYNSIPAQLVAVVYLLAAGGFVSRYRMAARGRVYVAPLMSLAVAGALILAAMFYLLVVPLPSLTLQAKAGALRFLLLALGLVLIMYNLHTLWWRNGADSSGD